MLCRYQTWRRCLMFNKLSTFHIHIWMPILLLTVRENWSAYYVYKSCRSSMQTWRIWRVNALSNIASRSDCSIVSIQSTLAGEDLTSNLSRAEQGKSIESSWTKSEDLNSVDVGADTTYLLQTPADPRHVPQSSVDRLPHQAAIRPRIFPIIIAKSQSSEYPNRDNVRVYIVRAVQEPS